MDSMVSVVIPTYNREKTISRAIDSVLSQTYTDIEIIVVDDGSTDRTIHLLDQYSSKITVFKQDHRGANAARNLGIKNAKGKYIAFLDSDDEWLPNKIAIQINYMCDTNKKICFCPHELIDTINRVIPDDYRDCIKYEKNLKNILRGGNVITTSAVVVAKEVLDDVGFFNEQLRRLQDYELLIRIAKKYEIGFVPQILVKQYRMEECITNHDEYMASSCGAIIREHSDFVDQEKLLMMVIATYERSYKKKEDGDIIEYIAEQTKLPINEIKDVVLKWYISSYKQKTEHADSIIENNYDLFMRKNKGKPIFLLGTGKISERVYQSLSNIGIVPEAFLVTNNSSEKAYFHDIEVKSVGEADRQLPIIIAVGYNLQPEVSKELYSLGFENYCCYPLSYLE